MLGLGKKQYAAARARRIHRRADQCIAARGQNDRIGPAAFAGRADRANKILPRRIDAQLKPEVRRNRHAAPGKGPR